MFPLCLLLSVFFFGTWYILQHKWTKYLENFTTCQLELHLANMRLQRIAQLQQETLDTALWVEIIRQRKAYLASKRKKHVQFSPTLASFPEQPDFEDLGYSDDIPLPTRSYVKTC
jgi:hypothetical protein